ncbi:thiol reductant ABC exporter subunit CydC [Alkalicoccus daliensis]|uniref:ATP-binding cassette, subfamily C, CydC n=1 Tax=Alkalicoccus daliensis TaxID=745820 RepID=A0A1H0KI50_9BACI|nr:thiol reductant ABC exporter subunit CydC [Alkalicoccus daliensis]SDO55431.1 ATP-binding cassette, subfamily C, CydC [Alkalicoccus daliensis]
MKEITRLLLTEKRDIFLSVLFGFLAGMGAVALFANSGYLISRAAVAPPLAVLTVTIALLKLFSFTRALSRYGERYYSHRATFTMLSNIRSHFFQRLEPLAPRISHKFKSGDLLSRIVGDVESLQNYFLRVYYPPIVMITVFLATIAFTAYFSIPVAVILIAGVLVTGWLIPAWFQVRHRKISSEIRKARGEVSTEITEFLYGFQDLKLHQKLEEKEDALLASSRHYIEEQAGASHRRLASVSWNQSIAFTISWIVLAAGAYLTAEGQMEGVFLAMLVMVSLTVFENATPMAAYPSYAEESRQAAARLEEVMQDESSRLPEKKQLRALPQGTPEISFQGASFTYPEESRSVLKEINLTIAPGTKTAVVGGSGSGKSTMIQLILGIYLPEDGKVSISGISTEELEDKKIWEKTNAILQDQHFFFGTVRENLLISNDEANDAQMKNALARMNLAYLSLDTTLTEKGKNLSGGERQRLGLARSMLREAELWLLDEPTSSVDAATEAKVMNEIFTEAENKTLILVSHKLQGLEDMDQIVVMDHGSIAETGTFAELMEKRGVFYQMKQIEAELFAAG